MILIGQFDSPFVRRVAIAMRLYGIAFEHKPWSTFGDADKIAPYNPLRRVPTLVLDDGEALIESAMILDYLDDLVGPERAMIARSGETRRRHLRICALAMGLGDKGVSLLYERVLRKEKQLDLWVERCKSQISGVLDMLEKERAAVKTPYWSGENIGHADIAVACVLRFTGDTAWLSAIDWSKPVDAQAAKAAGLVHEIVDLASLKEVARAASVAHAV